MRKKIDNIWYKSINERRGSCVGCDLLPCANRTFSFNDFMYNREYCINNQIIWKEEKRLDKLKRVLG